jgi:cyanophycinase
MIAVGRSARVVVTAVALLSATISGGHTLTASEPGVPHRADAVRGGPLLVIGGGLRPDNALLIRRMIDAAGGVERSRWVVFTTASRSGASAERFRQMLAQYGVPLAQTTVLDVRPENAATATRDPAVLAAIRRSTAAYFVGGDQQRITRTFRAPDGSDTPALAELRRRWNEGALVAGTSAGAAMQSETMIGVAGLPDRAMDEGMDALDFGLTDNPNRRGLLVTPGLGFFRGGIIDQHFSQYRGRLGRLARAVIDRGVRFGFGVDENTAMLVSPSGAVEVVGAGCVTIVDAADAKCHDGPLGCRIEGLRVSCFQTGDRIDPATGSVQVHPGKILSIPGTETFHGNHLVPDIAAGGAVPYALFLGLADNTSRKLVGVALRYTGSTGNDAFGHGYRLVFQKSDRTKCWSGYVDHFHAYAVHGVDLRIEPITAHLQPPASTDPIDLPEEGAAGTACRALWFRGLLTADSERRFRPDDATTRGEFARAVVQAVHLLPRTSRQAAVDVPEETATADAVDRLLEAGLIELDDHGNFRPNDPILRHEAADVLARMLRIVGAENLETTPTMAAKPSKEALAYSDGDKLPPRARQAVWETIQTGLLAAADGKFRPSDPLKRVDAALALYRILRFPW